MRVERSLQIAIATLTVLGVLLLSMGQRFPTLPLWVLIAVICSLWLTDVTGWLRLNRTMTNLAVVVALGLSFRELLQFRGGVQILGIANLLVYLQAILLFQRKEFRTYWQLAVLSLLQVIVAAAFSQGFSFGPLLVAYLFVGLSVLALFFLHRERSLLDRAESPADAKSPAAASPAPGGSRWPLSGQEAALSGTRPRVAAGLGTEFWGRLVKMALGTLLLAMVIFFAIPRLGTGALYGARLVPLSTVGFSETVSLGALGKVIENPTEVLRIQFLEEATNKLYEVAGGIYLRGAVLTRYRKGTWSFHTRGGIQGYEVPLPPADPLSRIGVVRQKITIEPLNRDELFCVWPIVGLDPDEHVRLDLWYGRLVRPGHEGIRFSFELGTTALADHLQKPLVPAGTRINRRLLLQLPPADQIPELIKQANQWIADSRLPAGDRLGRARLLESMLRDSARFRYSLQGQPRQPGIDPIEDFIKNNPRGHCEYFATALVLMLRSQGIPARMVVGFKSNEWNNLGGFFEVRQLHAHTWVEAYLEARHIPPELFHGDCPWQWGDGGWLRLDPTPAARDLGADGFASLWGMGRYFDWLDYVWDSYVIEMDSPRQHETIYDPLAESAKAAARSLADPQWWRRVWRGAGNALRTAQQIIFAAAWRAALASVVAGLLLVLAYYGFRWALRRLVSWLTGRVDSAGGARRARVEFYRRLEAVLARYGLIRCVSQTQREFAHEAEARIAASTGDYRLAGLPGQVVEAFYSVRFGGAALDKLQAEAVEEALKALAQAADGR